MTTQKVFSSRALNVNADVYVGEAGRLFYAQPSGVGTAPVLKYSDGSTPGGLPLSGGSLTFSSPNPPPNPSEGNLWWHTDDGRLYVYYDANWVDASPDTGGYTTTATVNSLILAASHPAWSITSGTTNVTVDAAGGITMSANSLLTAFDSDLNIQVANTSHSINIFGEFHVHAPSVLGITPEPIFRVLQDGQVRILVPKQDFYEGGVSIVGSTSSNFISPQNLGVMLHITGQLSQPNRFYMDGNNTYNAFIGRRFGGTVANPTAVVKDEPILRLGAVGYDGSAFSTVASSRIAFVASENYTPSAQGGRIEFYTNATGTNILPTTADIRIDSHGLTFRDGTSQDTAGIPLSQKGFAFGVATLDSGGKVPPEQLAAGALIYKGAWNAATNSPYLFASSSTYSTGWEYSVNNTGTQTLNTLTGVDTFNPGDYIIYNGTSWDRIPGKSGSVVSFNGRIGDVVMTTTDVINVLTPASIATNRLVNNGFTFSSGPGIQVTNNGIASPLGTAITISNYGVTSLSSNTATITLSANTGSININWVNTPGYLTSGTVNQYVTPFNTGTLVAQAVTAGTADTVTTAAQPAITSVGTLTSLTVSGSITDSIGNVRSIAIRNTATSYVLTAADNGQMVSITTGSVTINSGIFASPFGQTISIYNNSTTSMSILAGSGVTLRLAGTLSTGTRTLARYGVATTICVSSNTFVVSGAGLS